MTLVLVGIMAFGTLLATAADHDGDKGKKKGKPSFVDEKHRAHAEWKREKEYEKARKKQYRDYDDDDDRWEDRRRDDERWERRREDERRAERCERDRDNERWGRTGDTRREIPGSRKDRDRSLAKVILEERHKSENRR
ncbi:hypothetical protein OB13_13760 [Pontibacter sp. HJ8]